MLLSHDAIKALVNRGVVEHAKEEAINAASLDIHLGDLILYEDLDEDLGYVPMLDYAAREKPKWKTHHMDQRGFVLDPGEFVLAQTKEVFNLPNNISAEYKLKSSMARIGLEHMNAGWCDAGWNGSVLTLEFKNMSRRHSIILRPGDAVGQIIFFKHEPVGDEASYATRGRYNNDLTVKTIKE